MRKWQYDVLAVTQTITPTAGTIVEPATSAPAAYVYISFDFNFVGCCAFLALSTQSAAQVKLSVFSSFAQLSGTFNLGFMLLFEPAGLV